VNPAPPILVIFDVDGTLVRSSGVDGEVFARTFEAQFGVALPSTDWSDYPFVTDQGIAEEALSRLGMEPGGISAFKASFLAALAQALRAAPLAPVAGARSVIPALLRAGHRAAIATGGWSAGARLKLASAGVDVAGRALVGSDERRDRADVVREAIRRAEAPGLRTVYVGDAPWDAVTTASLSLPLVGVDPDGTGRLAALGVDTVIAAFDDFAHFCEAIAHAGVRGPRRG